MIQIAVVLVAALLGFALARWWAVAIPTALAVLLLIALNATGNDATDTPIPFFSLLATIGVTFGVVIRRRRLRANR